MKPRSLRRLALPVAISAALLAGCGPQQQATTPAQPAVVVQQQSESDKANALFEQIFMDNVRRNPVTQLFMRFITVVALLIPFVIIAAQAAGNRVCYLPCFAVRPAIRPRAPG